MKSFVKEFKEFISRGNVLDMAVGIVVGSAFTGIVTSLVENVFTPLIGIIIGGIDFKGLAVTVGSATLNYGLFIQSVINFLLVAFCVFCVIKSINTMRDKMTAKAKASQDEPAPEDPVDVALLKEIRDLLKEQAGK